MKTNVFKTSVAVKIMMLIMAMPFLTGCSAIGSKQKAAAKTSVEQGDDITRPPSLIQQTRNTESESNPEETVSYDEWRKRRNDAAAQDDSGSGTELEEIKELEEPEEPTKIP